MKQPRIYRYKTIYGTYRFEKVPLAWTKFMVENRANQVTNSKGDIIWQVPGERGDEMKGLLEGIKAIVEDIPAPPH
jgi:hypothetical protein